MATTSTALGRPADRTRLIVQALRSQIVEGELPPGGQLPTREEFERRFGAGATTVQKALEQLRRDGFVEVNGRQGTYVVQNPPHLTRYAIVFPHLQDSPHWRRFWTALSNEVIQLEASQSRPADVLLPIYYGVNGNQYSPDTDRLIREVQSQQVAGLIFTTSPHLVENTPLLEETGVPRVAIMTWGRMTGISAVCHDHWSFGDKAIGYFAARRRRRVAVVSPPLQGSLYERWAPHLRDHGLTTRSYWMQMVHLDCAEAAENCVHLLVHGPQDERPDALVVADDNLVVHAMRGLQAAGLRVPEDIEVVAHANFPCQVQTAVPVRQLGYDARRIMAACIDSIDRQRAGDTSVTITNIPAYFEDELP